MCFWCKVEEGIVCWWELWLGWLVVLMDIVNDVFECWVFFVEGWVCCNWVKDEVCLEMCYEFCEENDVWMVDLIKGLGFWWYDLSLCFFVFYCLLLEWDKINFNGF